VHFRRPRARAARRAFPTQDWSRVPDAEAIFDAEDRAFLEIGAELGDDDYDFE
jgi:hypothetical protein